MAVHHQHQCGNSQFATCTRSQVALTTAGILLDSSNKSLHTTTLDGLTRQCIHFAGIIIGWIVREVAADDEKTIFSKIGFQHLSDAPQLTEIVCRDDDGYDRWHMLKSPLQERQLYLQTMLPVVSLRLIGENTICRCQLPSCLTIHFHLAQGRSIIVGLCVNRSTIEPFMMTRSKQEYTLIGLVCGNRHIGRCCHMT